MRILLNAEESIKELILQLNGNFTDAEKENCVSTIHKIVRLAHLVRADGILGLESELEQEPSGFFKTALLLLLNGNAPVTVKQILQNMIVADRYSGSQLLDRLLIAEGVLAIQRWENPDTIALKLNSILGENYVLPMKEAALTQSEKIKKYSDFLNSLKDKVSLPKSTLFETKFSQLYDKSIQLVIHCVDNEDLILALNGCGFGLIHKVLDNVSINRCLRICENWEHFKILDNDFIFSAQEDIIKVIETLEDMGQINKISNLIDD